MAAGGSEIILSIKDVSKSFPGVKALDGVSIDVRRGTVHGIVGENGAGKSTLMKILSGVYQKDSGTIEFDGARVEHTTPHQSMQSGLAIIYQELNLVNTMSVGENVFLGRFKEMKGMRGTHAKARELLDSIGCKVPTTRLVSELSVSEKQMVEIVKALSFSSKLIIMDEPSSSLTGEEMAELVTIIHQLKEKGISIIYISHKLDEIFQFCDIVSVMRDGRVVDTKAVAEFTRNELISKMVGRTIENEYPPRPHSVGEVVMEVRSITHPQAPRHLLHASQGRDPGPRRPRRRGPHRDRPGHLRRRQGTRTRGPPGRQARDDSQSPACQGLRHRADPGGPQAPGPRPALFR